MKLYIIFINIYHTCLVTSNFKILPIVTYGNFHRGFFFNRCPSHPGYYHQHCHLSDGVTWSGVFTRVY